MTFREEVQNDRCESSKEGFQKYIQSRDEWLSVEYKQALDADNYNIRKAVSSLANTDGGELIIGITNNKMIIGTEFNIEKFQEILKQNGVPTDPHPEYTSDLLTLIINRISIPFEKDGIKFYIHVLEINPSTRMAFAYHDKNKTLTPYLRRGSSSEPMSSVEILQWNQRTSRTKILLGLYEELKQVSNQFCIGHLAPENAINMDLHFLKKIQEDGMKYLTEDDKVHLFGKPLTTGGVLGGIYQYYHEIKAKLEHEKRTQSEFWKFRQAAEKIFIQDAHRVGNDVASFKAYLKRQGIDTDTK